MKFKKDLIRPSQIRKKKDKAIFKIIFPGCPESYRRKLDRNLIIRIGKHG